MRDHHPQPLAREPAAAILKIAEGWSISAVAQKGLLKKRTNETVGLWRQNYQKRGIAGLLLKPGRGRKPSFPPQYQDEIAARQALLEVLHQAPAQEQVRWRLDALLIVCNC